MIRCAHIARLRRQDRIERLLESDRRTPDGLLERATVVEQPSLRGAGIGIGNDVGPNLETVRDWDSEKMLLNILDPNREVAPNYVSYDIELKDGASMAGLIVNETDGGITLKKQGGGEETILRQTIAKMSSSGLSLMPEGLEANIAPQDFADLIAFLQARN